MDQYLQTALKQAPILAVTLGGLLYIVRTFLAHINNAAEVQERREQMRQEIDRARAESIGHLGDKCHSVQSEATEVMAAVRVTLEANTAVLKENNEVLRQNNFAFQEIVQTHRQLVDRLRDLTHKEQL